VARGEGMAGWVLARGSGSAELSETGGSAQSCEVGRVRVVE
jgi:hypothetical protein